MRRAPGVTAARLTVNRMPVTVFITPPHLGALRGVFLDNEYNLSKVLPDIRPATILDLGANVGMAAVYLHALYPDVHIACVEPDPRNLKLLEQTIATNRVNVTLVQGAVAAEAGRLRLRMGDNPTCSALETSPMHKLDSSVEVDVFTVPQLLERLGWKSVDLLKVDIEGTEQELFARNNNWLHKVGAIVLEIHPNTSPEEIGEYLVPFGFRLRRLGHGAEPVYIADK
ncbi:MAG: FkbM family methyltransferase [Pirellulales bacterium]